MFGQFGKDFHLYRGHQYLGGKESHADLKDRIGSYFVHKFIAPGNRP
jgi:hypothetical protein